MSNENMMKLELSPYADRADTKCIYLNKKAAGGVLKTTGEESMDAVRRKYDISITGYPCMKYDSDNKGIRVIVDDKLNTSQISSDLVKNINSPFDDYILIFSRKSTRARG